VGYKKVQRKMDETRRMNNSGRSIRRIEEEEEDDDNEELSGAANEPADDLHTFREQWKKELEEATTNPSGSQHNSENIDEGCAEDVHMKAREMFLEAVALEEKGKLYEAIRFYKKAEALVPNIEQEAFAYTRNKFDKQEKVRISESEDHDENGNGCHGNNNANDLEDNDDITNLCAKFSRLKCASRFSVEFETNMTHISNLPSEVLNYILKWVVSQDLDLLSLESCSAVSRGFYLAARDEEIWRLICVKIWGPVAATNLYSSWRDMFLVRPRVHFNGCYTNKVSYIREGERGFQDLVTYRAWHVVEYHRFVRFFPGGRLLMVTSADDDPALVMKQMNNRISCSLQGAMMGDYRLVDGIVVCSLKKPKDATKKPAARFRRNRRDALKYYDVPEQEFHLEFYIKGFDFKSLHWKCYNITSKYKSGQEQLSEFDVTNQNNYPRMQFTPVTTYHFETDSHLT